ncbi:phosphotransferase [Shewanella sp. YLB-07]|uniref:phosphotransferase n=1 Tax=Shewanella sp. YLB-07 TaxID=2601268 RepID=UPI00128D79D1|nr:phosphotransferase [Shewanella sp. YLB-07]MPY25324.1 phosphotransferase [Shewanella sp. YLB-07]
MFELGIAGNSGCELSISKINHKLAVVKRSSSKHYSSRLKLQMQKQELFAKECDLKNIVIPNIITSLSEAENFEFTMEFVHGSGFDELSLQCGKQTLDQIVDALKELLTYEIERSPITTVPAHIFQTKVQQVIKNSEAIIASGELTDSTLRALKDASLKANVDRTIPQGICHGDLTLSNLIYSKLNKKVHVIDFLDSFIESPIIDICKIRQDTLHGWSRCKSELRHNARTTQALTYLDEQLAPFFSQFDWVNEHYDFFQDINILRIIPYAHSEQVINFINQYFGAKK